MFFKVIVFYKKYQIWFSFSFNSAFIYFAFTITKTTTFLANAITQINSNMNFNNNSMNSNNKKSNNIDINNDEVILQLSADSKKIVLLFWHFTGSFLFAFAKNFVLKQLWFTKCVENFVVYERALV